LRPRRLVSSFRAIGCAAASAARAANSFAADATPELLALPRLGEAIGEVLDVALGLEADQIVRLERRQKLPAARHRRPHVGGRPRNMEEEADAVAQPLAAELLGKRDQMVVVHPDQVVGTDLAAEDTGEAAIDPEVAVEILLAEFHEVRPVVQERPQGPVGESKIVFTNVRLAEVEDTEDDVAVDARLDRLEIALAAGRLAGPAEPHATRRCQCTTQGDSEATGIAGPAGQRHPVRDHDQSSHLSLRRGTSNGYAITRIAVKCAGS
jgi:hypothetical protein